VKTPRGFIAMLIAPDNKTYVVRANDRLYDGTVRAISEDAVVFLQEVNDPLSLVKQREVRRPLRRCRRGSDAAPWRAGEADSACLPDGGGRRCGAGRTRPRPLGRRLGSKRSDGQTVFIESTEPVAYVVKRPDPLTVLVDLQDVAVSAAATQALQLAEGPVRAVHVGEVAATGGDAVARVRLELSTPTPHRVQSARNTIRVEFARTADPAVPAPAAASRELPRNRRAVPVSPRPCGPSRRRPMGTDDGHAQR